MSSKQRVSKYNFVAASLPAMFEINLLSSDDALPAISTPPRKNEPEVIDLLSSSPVRASPASKRIVHNTLPAEPRTPPLKQTPVFELSSSPILKVYEPVQRGSNDDFMLSSSPSLRLHQMSPTPIAAQDNLNITAASQPTVSADPVPKAPSKVAKRAFKSNTEVDLPRSKNGSKRFKATKSNSAPAAVKLVTDRKKACEEVKCSIWDISGSWTELLEQAFTTLEMHVPCNSSTAPSQLEGVAAVVTVSGEFTDEWDDAQHLFVRAVPHIEFMSTHIVVLQPEQLDLLGKEDRHIRDAYFHRIRNSIADSGECDPSFSVVYVVPEVHVQFRKMMAAYDRRLRQRVMDHNNGLAVSAETPPQQHYFNDVQVRLQVENQIRAIYPRTKAEAAECIANWVIDMCFSRYRMRTDATLEGVGGSVKSKSAVPEIAAEALAVVHGLPPRIASSIAGDMKSMGKIYSSLASNPRQQQMARLRYYGKGDWNESLIALLTCDDPNRTIGQA